jgi:multicomponent Na+:H+ antiporter subunit F
MLAFLAFFIVRAVKGPSIWDRLLGLSLIATKVMLIIVFFASYNQIAYLLDLAIVYALLGFIGTLFTARFLLQRVKGGED